MKMKMGSSSGDDELVCDRGLRFMQPLRPSFLNAFSIPKSFLKNLEFDSKGDHLQSVFLMTVDEPQRHWAVSVRGGRFFTDGWKEFSQHLDLRVGEFVVFTYHSHLLFHVSVFEPLTACQRIPSSHHLKPVSVTKGSKRHRVELKSTCKTEAKEIKAAIPSKQDHSSCLIRLTTYNVKQKMLRFPMGFVREHGLQLRRCEMMIIDAKQRIWPVTMNYKKSNGEVYIIRGWEPVLSANLFKPGDLLHVKLIKGGHCPTLKCHRVDRVEVEPNSACKIRPKEAQAERLAASPSQQDQSLHPKCNIHLSSSAVERSVVYLPVRFARECDLKCGRYEVKFLDEEERTWEASLMIIRYRAYICQGWRDVQTANCFVPGDDISIQLLEAGKRLMFRCYRSSRRIKG